MMHDAFGVYSAGVALAVCSCGWRERLEHGTRGQAQTLADEHARLAPVADQDARRLRELSLLMTLPTR